MTVATEVRSVVYVGDNVATDFPVPFEVLDDTHVRVTFTPIIGSPVVMTLGANPGFTLNAPAPNITSIKNCFPVSASVPAPGGTLITVERVVPVTQAVDLSNQGTFDAETHEEMADLGVMVDQQLADRITALETASVPADLVAGNGLSFAGPTLNVNAHADGSIISAADDIRVGVLATDAQHGNRGGGALHANAVSGGAAGFMSGTDKQRADALWGRTLTAGAGLTGTGDLSANRTFAVGANADGSILVNADDVQVGVLATDAQHGVRGGGTQHAVAVASGAAGFMSGADKAKLDGLTALNQLSGTVETADAVQTNIISYTPADNTAELVEVFIVATRKGGGGEGGDSAGYRYFFTVKRSTGTTALVATTPVVALGAGEDVGEWDASNLAVITSPMVNIQVKGVAATTIRWAAVITRLAVSQ